ncbi:MAG: TetR/AcrR family transcriptional regulator [Blastocatellia bacterium]|nr:TetR/AcrR family transcriptional regulator [Blastocatellia bacterium]
MSVGRPLEFEPEKALQAAMEVFWRQGYEATSLQDLLKAMKLSKSSFYQSFGSKHQLFEMCINRYQDMVTATMIEALNHSSSAREFILNSFYTVAKEARKGKTKGCLVLNSANEFSQNDPVIAACVASGIENFTNVFLLAVKRAQSEGTISTNKTAEALASYLMSSMSGIKTLVKAGTSETKVKEIIEIVISVLD